MSRKRNALDDAHDSEDASKFHSSPRKRSRNDSPTYPRTPAHSGSSSSPHKTPIFATPKTPYTPYPLHASDSPSNPFGRKRTERLIHTLPPISSFSKHAVLRFQFVRKGVSPRQGGVHRIVRVPMSYTFTHLRCLIAWLFETPATYANATNEEYLFEVRSKVAVYSPLYKPGQIKSGVTTVKLSNMRDPGRWHSLYGLLDEEDELSEGEGEEAERESELCTDDGAEDESDEWRWADEEDFTLGHAFPRGIDAEIAIIYHHSPSTQIHITVNKSVLPRQRGRANTPFVFNGRGHVHLSPPPLPRPVFSKSIFDIMSSSPAQVNARRPSKSKGKGLFPLNSSSPFHPSCASKEQNLSDVDADGDTDQDLEGDFPHSFDANHPFFHAQGSSPIKLVKEYDNEIVLVGDSDDEDEYSESGEEEEDTMEEDHNTDIDPDKWNEPLHSFALYLLRYMDPHGTEYGDVDESFFEEEVVFDPFDNDDESVQAEVEEEKIEIELEQDEESDAGEFDGADEEEEEYGYEEDITGEGADERDEAEDEAYEDEEEEEEEDFLQIEEELKVHDTQRSTPGLTNCASSSSSLPPSSPQRHLPSPSHSYYFYDNNASSVSLPDPTEFGFILEEHYPNKKYTQTPAPPKARKYRLRIKRLERQLAKIKKSAFMTKHDEKVEDEAATGKEAEVDELAGDDDGGKDAEEEEDMEEDVQEKERDYDARLKWRKPSSKSGEIWDPFGDEVEL
ncbi:hypothetical protein CVT25_011447 [Psilocybe cyanescens]|uniref:Uncharacterized protein n=1 Tax=Psilocybe cyanescens TaxID=93625 RepID=A0A409XAC7_PSICY|nr:hypothetical protein CVT25_011447 [Psilocybe cyanescens]